MEIHPIGFATAVEGQAFRLETGTGRLATAVNPLDLVLDYGRTQVGQVELKVRGHGVLRLRYGEDLEEALVVDDPYPSTFWYVLPKDDFELTGDVQEVRCAGRRAWRFLNVHLDAGGDCEILSLRAESVHAPFNVRGAFHCSDPELERIWQISEHTLRICRQRYIEDGVKRDGLLWAGDYRVAFLASIMLDPDPALSATCLRMMAASRRPDGRMSACAILGGGAWRPTDMPYLSPGLVDPDGFLGNWILVNYESDFVASLYEYALYTGDRDLPRELWPVARQILDGVAATDLRVLPDAERGLDFLTDTRPDVGDMLKLHAALEMQVAEALAVAASLADLLADEPYARKCRAEHQRRVAAWRDQWRIAEFANWNPLDTAVLAEALTEPVAKAAVAALAARQVELPRCGFTAFWHWTALWRLGCDRLALEHLRRWYAPMLRAGATTTWEVSQPEWAALRFRRDIPTYSHAHSWSAGPCWLFPTQILGVRPTALGFGEIHVAPQASGLKWAQGIVPTPHGNIEIELDFDRAHGRLTLPDAVTAVIPASTAGGATKHIQGQTTEFSMGS